MTAPTDLQPKTHIIGDIHPGVARLTYEMNDHVEGDHDQYVAWRSASESENLRVGDELDSPGWPAALHVMAVPVHGSHFDPPPLLVWDPASRQLLDVHILPMFGISVTHGAGDLVLEAQRLDMQIDAHSLALTNLKNSLMPLLQQIRDNAGAGVDWDLMDETERILNSL